jgi:5-methylcytosine-specific restriction endonuclease McrA
MGEEPAEDPLALGQRIVEMLETGARTATYKLATLLALVDHCIEHLPARADSPLVVPIDDLAHRVIEVYWRQVVPFEGQELRQSTQPVARILRAVSRLREASGANRSGLSLDVARLRHPDAYKRAVDDVALTLVQQPLHRLQKLPGQSAGDPFMYDDAWMHDQVSRRTVEEHGGTLELLPGVATGLARLAGLLKPTVEIIWVADVRRMNRHLDADVPDVAGHLFGRERLSLNPVRAAFKEAYGPRCFYCAAALPPDNPVDHVLPWSRLGIDGLANLVLACRRCNGQKLQALPAISLVDAALARDRSTLEGIADSLAWPTQYDRVVAAARGLYLGQPSGTPTWVNPGKSERLDISFGPPWLQWSRSEVR